MHIVVLVWHQQRQGRKLRGGIRGAWNRRLIGNEKCPPVLEDAQSGLIYTLGL